MGSACCCCFDHRTWRWRWRRRGRGRWRRARGRACVPGSMSCALTASRVEKRTAPWQRQKGVRGGGGGDRRRWCRWRRQAQWGRS